MNLANRTPAQWGVIALGVAIGAWSLAAFAPMFSGYFVSDDVVPLVLFDQWRAEGRLGEMLASKFWTGLDAGANRFYRPLSYLSMGVNYAMSGADPAGWLWMNVVTHAICGALVALIALQLLERRDATAWAAALIGAAAFLFASPGAEVVGWASGRFDGFATLFTLASCAFFLGSRRPWDGRFVLSLASAAAAMLSKESSAIVPVAIVLLGWARAQGEASPDVAANRARAFRLTSLWVALGVAYLGLRYAIFGSAFEVYAGSRPGIAMIQGGYWTDLVTGFPPWLAQQLPGDGARKAIYLLTVALAAMVGIALVKDRSARPAILAVVATVAMTVVLLLPHMGKAPEDGIGGRLYYQTAAFYGVMIALLLATTRMPRLVWPLAVALVVLHGAAQWTLLERWKAVHRDLRDIAVGIERLHATLGPGDYAVVLLPQARASIPFAANMQAGLILPPLQPRVLTERLVVQVYSEIPDLGGKVADGLVTTLRAKTVLQWAAGERVRSPTVEYPNRIACWNSARRTMVMLPVAPGPTPEPWTKAIRAALAATDCDRHFPSRVAGG